jgi:hypothetical protein
MKTTRTRSSFPRRAALAALALTALATSGAGCLTRPLEPIDSRTTWTAHFKQTSGGIDKIDLLLMIDNSASMADKQTILAEAVPNLVKGLLNPACVDKDSKPIANQPASPADACPKGSAREFEPVFDVHIGIVSSSLGSHGTVDCKADPNKPISQSNDDHGHLLSRTDAADPSQTVPTYNNKGFLAWDPKQALTPPGEKDLQSTIDKLGKMVKGVGQIGCGYESQLESWYRFLVDPEPYGTITLDQNKNVVVKDIDHQLLDERAAFLRPDSMVAILMLTDENDCSTREERNFPLSNASVEKMPRARAICATDPNNHCCAPCTQELKDCPADDTCANPYLTPDEDPINLRCFDQKRRFGVDALYPVERYIKAITEAQIAKRDGQLVQNPLFPADPDGSLGARTPEMGLVFLAGIVGVPWQDIARTKADGTPDLVSGLDKDGKPVGGFMSADELTVRDPNTHLSRWDLILGDPSKGIEPADKLMLEKRDPRTGGASPIVGVPLQPPTANSPTAQPVNGHEWNTSVIKVNNRIYGDLQYACTFPLKQTHDCSASSAGCDCHQADTNGTDNPLCQDPSTGAYTQTQYRAKGYPGIRQLSVLKGVANQGIVASVCPAQVEVETAKDYGYNPAIGAIIEQLKHRLAGQCLNRPLDRDSKDQVSCVVIEASRSDGGACCTAAARTQVDVQYKGALDEAKNDPLTKGYDCFCQIPQLQDAALDACQQDVSPVPVDSNGNDVDGWCYVDAQIGAAALVSGCPSGQQQKIRFVGAGHPAGNAYTFITCAGGH